MNEETQAPLADTKPTWRRCVDGLAIAATIALAVMLAWRPINSNDVGYHLAYGDTFLDTGRIVDSNDFCYIEIDPKTLSDPGNMPPGAWYDIKTNKYHFPNANYGSQIVMSLVYRAGGFMGLGMLQVLLVAGTWVFMVLAMRRLGVGGAFIAGGCLLAALTAYERFNLRPEMFGFLLLAATMYLLAGKKITWLAVAALVVVQWMLVQVHSYWMLGLALTGAFWAEPVARAYWAHLISKKPVDAEIRRRVILLGVALAGMVAVVFINPWTWRLAVMPIQTLQFLRDNDITAGMDQASLHPWATIGEFFNPFEGAVFATKATYAFIAVLVVSGAGAIAAIWRKRWAHVLILSGMVMVAMGMRRNIAPTAVVLLPVSLGALAGAASRLRLGKMQWAHVATAIMVLAATGWFIASVTTSRFYYNERRSWRFASGPTTHDIPIATSELLKKLPRDVRVFTSYNVSSTVLYFSGDEQGLRDVPLVTNTWAFPAWTMADNLNYCRHPAGHDTWDLEPCKHPKHYDFSAFARRYNIGIVVLDCTKDNAPLAKVLKGDYNWRLVHFDGFNVIYVRSDVAVPKDFRDGRTFEQVIADIKANEILPAFTLHRMAASLFLMGVTGKAEEVWRECVAVDPDYHEAWNQLGVILIQRGHLQLSRGDLNGGRCSLLEAKTCFERALHAKSNYWRAKQNIKHVTQVLERLDRGAAQPSTMPLDNPPRR